MTWMDAVSAVGLFFGLLVLANMVVEALATAVRFFWRRPMARRRRNLRRRAW